MDPLTIMTLVSTGLNVAGKLMGGASSQAITTYQADAYGTQARTAQTNTDILNEQADVAGMGVDFAASKERQQIGAIAEAGRKTLSAQRSYFAGNNLDPSFGSPLLTQALTAGRITTDINLAQSSFAIDKANALSNEASLRGQAAGSAGQALTSLYSQMGAKMKGDADSTAAMLGAGSALLSGAASIAKGGSFSMPTLNLSSFGFDPIRGISGQ